jgi:excisionase family DNA binding protein
MEEKLVFTVDEAAEILGISRPTAYQAVERGDIPSLRIGRRILIPVSALKKRLETAAEAGNKPEAR